MKQEEYIRKAIRAGLPDKENTSPQHTCRCARFSSIKENSGRQRLFSKGEEQKPTTAQVVDQIKQIEKYINGYRVNFSTYLYKKSRIIYFAAFYNKSSALHSSSRWRAYQMVSTAGFIAYALLILLIKCIDFY